MAEPFAVNIEECNLSLKEKEELIGISSDATLKCQFSTFTTKSEFWLSIKTEYPQAFQSKILMWNSHIEEDQLEMFPNFDSFMRENDAVLDDFFFCIS